MVSPGLKTHSADLSDIFDRFSTRDRLKGANILITGVAGFLGYSFFNFFASHRERLGLTGLIGLDNFMLRPKPEWLDAFSDDDAIVVRSFDVVKDSYDSIPGIESVDYIIHLASIASPTFYRKFPLETIDANVWGLRRLLDFFGERPIRNLLYFSSSEIYGDPDPKFIPTDESYRGNVACVGPRACYDESKRFCETLLYVFHEKYSFKSVIVRPFNNYGPGMSLDDLRAPADFAKAVLENRDIVMFSDGTPTRTFCYISDAILGYLLALVSGEFDSYNIGSDGPELSIAEFAELFRRIGAESFDYDGQVRLETPKDKQYLVDNPNRRIPNIDRARSRLGFKPAIAPEVGIRKYLSHAGEAGLI